MLLLTSSSVLIESTPELGDLSRQPQQPHKRKARGFQLLTGVACWKSVGRPGRSSLRQVVPELQDNTTEQPRHGHKHHRKRISLEANNTNVLWLCMRLTVAGKLAPRLSSCDRAASAWALKRD